MNLFWPVNARATPALATEEYAADIATAKRIVVNDRRPGFIDILWNSYVTSVKQAEEQTGQTGRLLSRQNERLESFFYR